MKRSLFALFLLVSSCLIAQNSDQQYDFFVQYNGDQLTKKVNVADVLNHSVLKEYNAKNQKFSSQEIESIFKLNEKITIHGNYTDSLSYYQVTIPIKNSELLKEFLLQKNNKVDSTALASEVEILDFDRFSMVRADTISKKETIAWNSNYLIIFEYTNKYNFTDYATETLEEVDSFSETLSGEAEIEEAVSVVDSAAVASDESAEEPYLAEEPNVNEVYLSEKRDFDLLQIQSQEEYVQSLFENDFVMPYSDKIDGKADISSWINYSSFLESASKLYSALGVLSGMNGYFPPQFAMGEFVKGININAYFDADNARIEETIEYSEEMAKIMQKITDRKINKNIYSYFPSEKPLGYFSYHFNSEELLKGIPSFATQLFGESSPFGEDVALVTDLITTLVDEKATATLLDGDFSFFANDIVEKEITTTVYDYDENYEQIEVEKTSTKSIPIFTMVFTSTHPTFADRLLNLGVRKGLLEQVDDVYYFMEASEYGDIFVLKDKDVLVIGNNADDFNGRSNGVFVKEIKKTLNKNSFIGAVNFEKVARAYLNKTAEKSSADDKFLQLGRHFNSMEVRSPKRLKNNKFRIEMILNSSQNDKNIILQFLDAVQEMK